VLKTEDYKKADKSTLEVGRRKVIFYTEQKKQGVEDLADLAKRSDDCCHLFRLPGSAIKALTPPLALAVAVDSQVCSISALHT